MFCVTSSFIVHSDDILVYSQSLKEHVVHIRQDLTTLLKTKLFMKAEKYVSHYLCNYLGINYSE